MTGLALQPELRALMVFDHVPAGCTTFLCTDDYSQPHIRPGESVVVDTTDREPRHFELFVIQWQSGRRVICQARDTGRQDSAEPDQRLWSVGSLKRVEGGRAAVDAYIAAAMWNGGRTGQVQTLRGLGWSDGWFTTDHLASKLVGCVIGLYAPTFEGPTRMIGGPRA